MADTQNKINSIVNNDSIFNTMFNLYGRWQDEKEYEDIEEYGKVIVNVMNKQFPNYGITLVKSTKRPFGVKVGMDGKTIHIFTKISGKYGSICAKTEK